MKIKTPKTCRKCGITLDIINNHNDYICIKCFKKLLDQHELEELKNDKHNNFTKYNITKY